MAFAGHIRSLDFSYTPPGPALVANVHPDRHHHINLDRVSSKENIHGSSKIGNGYHSQHDDNQDAYNRNHNDDTPSDRLSFRAAVAAETDDKGHAPTTSLWIGNCPLDLNDEMLVRAFERFGPIVSVRATPVRRCGFVNFQHIESAMNVWHECHERDVFDIGIATWVRYQEPPSFLKDKHSSLKRKRSSIKAVAGISKDGSKRPIPTGPRSQTVDGRPPNGPKSQQTSISPPPPRRHDTYRPTDHSEEERIGRSVAERSRQSDSYRPTYEEDIEDSQTDRRASLQNRDGYPSRPRTQSQATALGSYRPSSFRSGGSPSPPPRAPQQPRQEVNISPLGIGIKGLAASRKESVGNIRDADDKSLPGVSIKGAAAQTGNKNREAHNTRLTQDVSNRQKSHIAEKASPHVKATPAMINLINETEVGSLASVPAANRFLSLTSSPPVRAQLQASLSTTAKIASEVISAKTSTVNEQKGPEKCTAVEARGKKQLEFLDYVFASKDREHLLVPKARTISPFGRRRPISRAKSVESAATDPTPITRPLPSAKEVCDRCEQVDSPFLRLQKCATILCAKMIHSKCGKSVSIS